MSDCNSQSITPVSASEMQLASTVTVEIIITKDAQLEATS
jgi:hypothetical protein